MFNKRTLCALAGGAVAAGALAAPAGASFVHPSHEREGLASVERRIPSRCLCDPVIDTITPNTCPRVRLAGVRVAPDDRDLPPGA